MIGTLVVDDDYMSASIHRSYVERIPGFMVLAEAHTGADALELARTLKPELVLLDIYLPDMTGLEVIRVLRQERQPADVIAVTAAKDVETLRAAVQGGVLHYIVKPFVFETFRTRLERYALLKHRLEHMEEPSQGEIDRLFSLLRVQGTARLPKGISAPTLAVVARVLRDEAGELPALEVAERAGVSRGTARRYLDYLATRGSVELTLRYGSAGRPEHRYRWLRPGAGARPDGGSGSPAAA